MIDCHEADRLMDERLDGELEGGASARLDEHLAACPACREAFAGLRGVLEAAGAMPRGLAPERDLWPGIAARLEAGRVAALRRPARRSAAWGLLAAAAVVLVAATAVITTSLVERGGTGRLAVTAATPSVRHAALADDDAMASGFEEYRRAAASLRAVLEQRRKELSPGTRAVLDDNLRVIGDAIGRIEAALAKEPRSRELRTLLAATYRQEIEVLRAAAEIPRRG